MQASRGSKPGPLKSGPSKSGPSKSGPSKSGPSKSGPSKSGPSKSGPPKTKRAQVVVACDACRKAKTKCSGVRPICRTCQDRSLDCVYSADADANPIIALKRKYTALNEAYTNQGHELALLQSQVGPGASNDAPATRVRGEGQVPIAQPPSSYLDTEQLTVATHGTYRNEPPVNHRVSRRREVEPINQAADILHALTLASDQDSIILLSRLRLGESWNAVADSLPVYQSLSDMNQRIDAYTRLGALPSAEFPDVYGAESAADQEAASASLRPWLVKLFDRQYFRQIFDVHRSSRSHMLPSELGSPAHFGNMPFSSAIAANHHPEPTQETQQHNYRVPIWARRVLNVTTLQADPFQDIINELQGDIADGIAVEDLCGPHPYVAALDDEDTFCRAPKLSRIVARMVVSLKPAESKTTFTQYAMMYKYWAQWRWLLNPTMETYADMPEFVRPTASQFFVAHPPVFDFVIAPGLRDLLITNDDPDISWFTEAAITIRCNWQGSSQAALCRNNLTNEVDFNSMYKSHVSSIANWTLGQSVRPFLPKQYEQAVHNIIQ